MGIILDIVVVATLALSIFMGYRKGLIGVAYNLCAFFVAIAITWILYTPITNFVIDNTLFDENIKTFIIEKSSIHEEEQKENTKNKNKKQEKDEKAKQNQNIEKYIEEYVKVPIKKGANNVIEDTADVISKKVLAIGVAVVLFVVVRLALLLFKFLAEGLAKLPIVKQFNTAGGIIYGALRGGIVIYLFLAVLFFVMSINNSGMVANAINTSFISKYLYANNVILNIIF